MTGFLASVANLAEARMVCDAGVDIVDLKNPATGALGALPLPMIETIVRELKGSVPISATVGDLPMIPAIVHEAVRATAATQVDYVKIGFFPDGNDPFVIDALAKLAGDTRLIAVLFADQVPDPAIISRLAAAGFAGVMLDTMDKSRGSLTAVATMDELRDFVGLASELDLLCGLAGSLREDDIPDLLPLRPDYLGFRGALCARNARTATLEPGRLAAIRQSIACPQPA